ncbi:mechanosensitive ion channel [Paenibacillus sp. F411]|uniref:Mechanosensing system component YbdG n=1 Tax=Paenibacillus algicola TaxID=2565926 RepID=A0A4P8XNC9_9BACL|nr:MULTISPECIES: mechanosensitive ion channel domain-containing protein [Paenibacillus]MBO2944075.1 mechanosensitive ion channel [Paenibacillus sp. F411]QCT01819.1 MscS Mechanosensitive ion channel [Paenibacillus algicola]
MDFIQDWLINMGVEGAMVTYLANGIMIAVIALLSIIANYVTKRVVLNVLTYYIHNNRYQWDNYLLERKVFHKLSHVVPAIIIYYSSYLFPAYQHLIEKGVMLYIIVVVLMVLNAFLNAINDIYNTYEVSKARPIRGYVQVVKIFIYIIGAILLISNMIGESPVILLSGIGALSAVIMLVFKDSILGLVAGVQLTSNDMVRVGDWIEMPKYGADGDVLDISLNTVKVQNFDKTITTIPTYALISDSFKNWRGMQTSGGRRIKRSIYVDMSSVSISSPEMIEKFRSIHCLQDYIAQKELEIQQYNLEHQIDELNKVNGRALTNLGTFRVYIECYLRRHPKIHKGMTCMVRQLQAGENGLPLEIYAFTNDIDWGVFENVQADVFDHIIAVAPEFGLRVFQNPSGHDLKQMLTPEQSERPERGYS